MLPACPADVWFCTYSRGRIHIFVVVSTFYECAGAGISTSLVGSMNGISAELVGREFAINQGVNVA